MSTRTFQIVAIVATVAVAGTVGLTAVATGGESSSSRIDLLGQLHRLGQHLHGGGHEPDAMTRLFDQLELTPDQRQRFKNVHAILGAHANVAPESMAELHDRLVAQFEQGRVETDEIRTVIDGHVEQIRTTAYAATDELITLVNGLDATQRQALLEHLQKADQRHHGLGH